MTHIFDNPLLPQDDGTDYKRDMEGTNLSAFPFHSFYEFFFEIYTLICLETKYNCQDYDIPAGKA